MGEDFEPSGHVSEFRPVSHQRILALMGILGLTGGIAGFAFSSLRFGIGILVGTALAFLNYYWLKSSLRRIFAAAESGERPRMLAGRYFLRYLVIATVVAVIYAADLLPIVALILGLSAFAFAVVIEGMIRIFAGRSLTG